MWTNVVIYAFLALIVFNLGAGLVYMMKDKGQSKRTVRALSWRIGLSILLFVLLIAGRMTGILKTNPDPVYGYPSQTDQKPGNE